MRAALVFGVIAFVVQGFICPGHAAEPLPSWKSGPTRDAIIRFVESVTDKESPDFVPPDQRIATFDNDGCLWSEKPYYFQLFFALDRIKQLAPKNPQWKTLQPFKAVLEGDRKKMADMSHEDIAKLVLVAHAGMTTNEFADIVQQWLKQARHPQKNRPYTQLAFQPMLELLEYLRDNGFKTYIVSGGGIEFLRVFAQEVYGVPPEQVIGSSIKTKFELRDGKPVLVRLQEIDFINDKEGKPIGINKYIGRRPIAAFGNSDGDLQMLQWTAAGSGLSFCLLVHHTDAEREWAYDRDSSVGRLDVAFNEARKKGWTVVDMKKDWEVIYPTRK